MIYESMTVVLKMRPLGPSPNDKTCAATWTKAITIYARWQILRADEMATLSAKRNF